MDFYAFQLDSVHFVDNNNNSSNSNNNGNNEPFLYLISNGYAIPNDEKLEQI